MTLTTWEDTCRFKPFLSAEQNPPCDWGFIFSYTVILTSFLYHISLFTVLEGGDWKIAPCSRGAEKTIPPPPLLALLGWGISYFYADRLLIIRPCFLDDSPGNAVCSPLAVFCNPDGHYSDCHHGCCCYHGPWPVVRTRGVCGALPCRLSPSVCSC